MTIKDILKAKNFNIFFKHEEGEKVVFELFTQLDTS